MAKKPKFIVEYLDWKSIYNPRDSISGTVSITNISKKKMKLRNLIILIQEQYMKYGSRWDGNTKFTGWLGIFKTLKNYKIKLNKTLLLDESEKFNFKIELPNSWRDRTRKKIKDWDIKLLISLEGGLLSKDITKSRTIPVDRGNGKAVTYKKYAAEINKMQSIQQMVETLENSQEGQLIDFRGLKIPLHEAKVLSNLEQQSSSLFELKKKIKSGTTMGILSNNGTDITAIGLFRSNINSLPEEIRTFECLDTFHGRGNNSLALSTENKTFIEGFIDYSI